MWTQMPIKIRTSISSIHLELNNFTFKCVDFKYYNLRRLLLIFSLLFNVTIIMFPFYYIHSLFKKLILYLKIILFNFITIASNIFFLNYFFFIIVIIILVKSV